MKKLLALVLAAGIVAVGGLGCGDSGTKKPDTKPTPAAPEKPKT